MKFLLCCFTALLIDVNVSPSFLMYTHPSLRKQILSTIVQKGIIDDCKNKSGVDQVVIDQAQKGNFTNDGKLETYYTCFGDEHGRHVGYLEDMPLKRTYIGDRLVHLANWNLLIFELRNWLVNKLQYGQKTVDDALTSCVPYNPKFSIILLAHKVLEINKCLSKRGVPVDAVSPNYVDRSVEDFNKLHDICKENYSGVDQNLIDEAQNGNVADSESLGSYYTCYSLNAGFLNMYGDILYNDLKNWFKLMLKQESDKVDAALDICYKPYVDQEKLLEEVLQIVKCFADEKLPVDVMANQ